MTQIFTYIGILASIVFAFKLLEQCCSYFKKFFSWLKDFIKNKFKKGDVNNG